MRFAMIVEYDGTGYSGWQRQKNVISVQQKIEEALERLFFKKMVIMGSGRTDKGVHAAGQVAHFDIETSLQPFRIKASLNSFLPEDIIIKDLFKVKDDFHSQLDAKSKIYVYKAYVSRVASPLKNRYYVQIIPPLDIDLMKKCAQKIVGKHDFAAFAVRNGERPSNTTREVTRIDIKQEGEILTFEVEGNGFLYKMVRSIVGTLVWIGRGKLQPSCIESMFATNERALGGKTLQANGLCLISVKY